MATVKDISTLARSATNRDSSGVVSATQITSWINLEYKRVRRELARIAPQLYTAVSNTTVLSGVQNTIAKPADFQALRRVEKLSDDGIHFFPVQATDELGPDMDELNWREQGANILLGTWDAIDLPGTYRLIYVQQPTTLQWDPSDDNPNDTLDLPDGVEDVVAERVSARVRERVEEDSAPNLRRADEVWREAARGLRERYGEHPHGGLKIVRNAV